MDSRLSKIIQAHIRKAMESRHENIMLLPNESNMTMCYIMIAGLSYPYRGGEYLFLMDIPAEFPHKPPGFKALTHNGVYEPGPRICISVGEYHATDTHTAAHGHRAARNLLGFVTEVLNGMLCPEGLKGGIGILNKSKEARQSIADASVEDNRRTNASVRGKFCELACADHPAFAEWQRSLARRKLAQSDAGAVATEFTASGDSSLFSKCFSPSFTAWISAQPGCARIVSAHAKTLALLDSDVYRRAYVLAYLAADAEPGQTRDIVERVAEELQCLRPHVQALLEPTIERWGKVRYLRWMVGVLRASMRQDFEKLDALLGVVQ